MASGYPLAGCALLCALISFTAYGQTCGPGELRVFVKDSQEAPVFDAQVRIVMGQKELGPKPTETTGTADFENVPCGSWTVHAVKNGFDESTEPVEITGIPQREITLILNPQVKHSSLDVTEAAPPVEQSSSANNEFHPSEVKTLPTNPATVTDALPLIPGVVRAPNGELKLDGSGEERSALVVNQSDVTDPATGRFGQTVPIDSVESVNVLSTPFLAQYGRFTQSVVAVETKRGGDKWHADLNDPFPDFRIRSYHMRGISNEIPRASLGGPLIHERLYFITALQYFIDKFASRTLSFPANVSKTQRYNSFTQIDYIQSARNLITVSLHISPQHTNFVNPEYFNPQPVTPSYAQHNQVGTAADHFGLLGGTIDSSYSLQRFDVNIGAQGPNGMIMTPEGNLGNYFGTQDREGFRKEWLEIWSPAPVRLSGTHQLKIGTSLTYAGERGNFTYRPVSLLNSTGVLLQTINFTNQGPFTRNDLEFTAYAQDHWALNSRLAFDYGLRVEHQRLASSLRIAPRAGFAWTPLADGRTVFRAGYGQFYDHIPVDVYGFSRYPIRTVTNYAPDGSVIGVPELFSNVIGSVTGPKSFLIHGNRVAGSFSPRGITWNAQVEHRFSRLLRVRGVYTDNRSVGLVEVEPELLGTVNEIVLNGDGTSSYRQAEITAKLTWESDQQLVMSYTRSRTEGNLNIFDAFVGNYPSAIVHPDVYTKLPGDLPNRFLIWGRVAIPVWSLKLMPIVEYRNGFPYIVYDAAQNYSGVPDSRRFPNFFSADARVMRDFRVSPKYTVRLSLSGFNLTNHFNALAIHSNIADPSYGIFFGNYHRRYRFDFEFVF